MKIKVVVAFLAVAAMMVVWAASAQAWHWHLPYNAAKRENRKLAEGICKSDPECVAYAWNVCQRVTDSRVDCLVSTWYEEPEGETRCSMVTHWGVNRRGYIVLKNRSRFRCYLE